MNNILSRVKLAINTVLLVLNIYAACITDDKILEQLFTAMTAITALYSFKIISSTASESVPAKSSSYEGGLLTEQ